MTTIIQEILQSERKPKEKVALLTEKIKGDKKLVAQLAELLKTATLVSKFDIMVKTEQNNGVKNVYLKALKILEKK